MKRLARAARRFALLSWLLFGCAGAPALAPPPPEPPPAERQSAPRQPEPADAGSPDADAVLTRALEIVARLRELPAKGAVRGRVISREEMLERVRQEIRSDVPEQAMAASSELLFALGTVDAEFDYEASVLKLMQAQLLGFYDPKRKTMFIGGDLGASLEDATLYHELVHALQDQHYDLGKLLEYGPDRGDVLSALHALAEGDATSAMMDAVFAPKGVRAIDIPESLLDLQAALGQAFSGVEGVPPILTRSLVAPYFDGLAFTHHLRRRAGWAEVDRAWRTLPASTEQILHPQKYLAGERPQVVAIPAAPPGFDGSAWHHDVLGEQSLRILFEEWMPAATAALAASDWAGDRVAVFRSAERRAVAWRLRFDTEEAAKRALTAFARGVLVPESDPAPRKAAGVTHEAATRAVRPGHLCRTRHSRGPFAAALRGRDVAVVLGPYARGASGARSAGECAAALKWARTLLPQRP